MKQDVDNSFCKKNEINENSRRINTNETKLTNYSKIIMHLQ